MTPSKLGALLGRLGRGKPKTITKAESARRRQSLAKVRKLRWKK